MVFNRLYNEKEYQQIMSYKQKAINTGSREIFLKWYKLYLMTERWYKIRSVILHRNNGYCEKCMSFKSSQVHHLNYKNVGNEKNEDLISLCSNCHEQIHHKNINKLEHISTVLEKVFDDLCIKNNNLHSDKSNKIIKN